jgi:hypothetical protein
MIRKALCLAAIVLASGCAIEGFNPVKNTPWGGMDYIFETPCKESYSNPFDTNPYPKGKNKKQTTDYMDRCSVTNKNFNLALRTD